MTSRTTASALPGHGILLLAALTLLWGVNWPILKIGLADVPVWVFRSLTGMTAAAGLFAIAALGRQRLAVPRREWPALLLASLLNMTLWNVLVLYGVAQMPSGRAAILAYTMPLWSTIGSMLLLGDRLTARQVAGLVLGLAGMGILLGDAAAAMQAAPVGALIIVGGAIAWGLGTVVVKAAAFSMPTTVLVAWQQLLGTVPILVITALYDIHNVGAVGLPAALAVLYNMTVTSILCYWIWFRIVDLVPVVVSSVGTLMIPVIGTISGAVLLGEQPGLTEIASLTLVAAAIVAVLLPGRRPGKNRP